MVFLIPNLSIYAYMKFRVYSDNLSYFFFKVLAIIYCDIDKESNHIPDEEQELLLVCHKSE
jgi:hypothetical protein